MDSCSGRKRPKITEPKPFSFESRDKQMAQKKQEKIKKVYEEEEKVNHMILISSLNCLLLLLFLFAGH